MTHYQILFAQLLYSIPILAGGWVVFENLQGPQLSMLVLTAFAYQCLVVAFFSYIVWFWMISRFAVSNLAAFTFFAPLYPRGNHLIRARYLDGLGRAGSRWNRHILGEP
jgi:drug/metabolite transporter (DMT)-like permease